MNNMKNMQQRGIELAANLAKRGFVMDTEFWIQKEIQLKTLRTEEQALNAKANKGGGTPEDKQRLKKIKQELAEQEAQWQQEANMIPNILHETVPEGLDATHNPEIKRVTYPEGAGVEDPYILMRDLGIDVEMGANLAGARFNVMQGPAATLHRKLIQAALDFYAARGYEECYVPYMVKEEVLQGTGQYPKFKDDMFKTAHGDHELYLIPTGEVPLTNLVREQILTEPTTKRVTHTPCFRKEAGAYGKDTRGIIRQHQFEKVELVRTCTPDEGLNNLHAMLDDVEAWLEKLGMTWRIIELCAGDIGFAGHKAYDAEIWFEQQKVWREVASITWCGDFQARRMNARYKKEGRTEFIHTLNGTGLAAGRVLAALIENRGMDMLDA